MSGEHDHRADHEHADHQHADDLARWKHDGVRVIKGDQLDANTLPKCHG